MPRTATQLWCPECERVTPCRSVTRYTATGDWPPEEDPGRWRLTDYPDLRFYRRWRECTRCGLVFATVEIREGILDELTEHRDSLAALNEAADAMVAGYGQVAPMLKKLKGITKKLRSARIRQP